MYATLGVAAATLLVVGGILAGPAILDCSRESGGFGACLRDRAADNGLITPDISSEPPPPAGWMEAAANEYETPASTPVDLEGTPANLLAEDAIAASSEPVEVAVVPPAELATATLAPNEESTSVALVGPQGEVSAKAAWSDGSSDAATALSQPEIGQLTATTPSQPVLEIAVAPEPIALADDLTSAVEPPSSEPAPVELSAEPVPDEPEPVPSEPSSSEPSSFEAEPSEPPSSEQSSEEPSSSEPVTVIEFNPQYPNVIVLPPPTVGDNSSFRALQLN